MDSSLTTEDEGQPSLKRSEKPRRAAGGFFFLNWEVLAYSSELTCDFYVISHAQKS